MAFWCLLAPEYPPTIGGIAGYVAQLGAALAAAGDEVEIWTKGDAQAETSSGGATVVVHALPSGFEPTARARISSALVGRPDAVVLLEYTPLAFGGLHPGFLAWVSTLRCPLWVMFHEVAFPFASGQPLRRHALAALTHLQAGVLLHRAAELLVSTPAWESMLRPIGLGHRTPTWLPIASNVPSSVSPERTRQVIRSELGVPLDAPVVGHFGTFGALVGEPLERLLRRLLAERPNLRAVLVGKGATEFVASRFDDAERARLHVCGEVSAERVAEALSCVDVVLCPFPDGVNSRRTTVMAALSLGKAVVTNAGRNSEDLWQREDCVELSSSDAEEMARRALRLLDDASRREQLGARAREVYLERFSMAATVKTLRNLRGLPPTELSAG